MDVLEKIRKSAVLLHILYHAAKQPVYGTWLLTELSEHGYKIGPGSLYPWLAELENQGVLSKKEELIEGKIRKYYALTEQGQRIFVEIKSYLKELYRELIEGKETQAERELRDQ